MIDRNGSWSKIITFIALTFAISAIFYSAMFFTSSTRDIGILWMWSPAASAFLTQWIFHGSLRDFCWKPGRLKYYLWGFIIPAHYALTIYGIAWATRLADFRPVLATWFIRPELSGKRGISRHFTFNNFQEQHDGQNP